MHLINVKCPAQNVQVLKVHMYPCKHTFFPPSLQPQKPFKSISITTLTLISCLEVLTRLSVKKTFQLRPHKYQICTKIFKILSADSRQFLQEFLMLCWHIWQIALPHITDDGSYLKMKPTVYVSLLFRVTEGCFKMFELLHSEGSNWVSLSEQQINKKIILHSYFNCAEEQNYLNFLLKICLMYSFDLTRKISHRCNISGLNSIKLVCRLRETITRDPHGLREISLHYLVPVIWQELYYYSAGKVGTFSGAHSSISYFKEKDNESWEILHDLLKYMVYECGLETIIKVITFTFPTAVYKPFIWPDDQFLNIITWKVLNPEKANYSNTVKIWQLLTMLVKNGTSLGFSA